MAFFAVLLSLSSLLTETSSTPLDSRKGSSCNSIDQGYQCFPELSHKWGLYAPYFSLEDQSPFPPELPDNCQVTFVQVLSRHGARYPTSSKSKSYAATIAAIQKNATAFPGKYAFLKSYNYSLGADDLTLFGQNQLQDSGVKFYHRYNALTRNTNPFVRTTDSDRVHESGEKFVQGFQNARQDDPRARPNQPSAQVDVVIPEGTAYNNTLEHSVCTAFEDSTVGDDAVANFTAVFAPAIAKRLEADLDGVQLSDDDVVNLMSMCPFETVSLTGDAHTLSPFCNLFTDAEWVQYNYLQSLDKYYGYAAGNPLGPVQGVGWANELIARLSHAPVQDHTCVNHTLDANPKTFPLNATLYADFSHDSVMVSIFWALGLYNGTKPLSTTTVQDITQTDGYSAAWSVPFAARAYIEMMQCRAEKEPLVRVLVNDRVMPLYGCTTDGLGRCTRDDFIQGLSFARSGGNWAQCFV
ncbi:3-phytase A [Aspergillus ambiguus]|uniref:histidine phosphatase family protein n=1 Tax=Aspergillus ambiguus TaxID=176160 RepID=UPI003CCD6F61